MRVGRATAAAKCRGGAEEKGAQRRLIGLARLSAAQGKGRGGGVWLGLNCAVRRRAVRAEQAEGRGRGGWAGGLAGQGSCAGWARLG